MAILTEEMKRLVRHQRLGYVATISPDGSPNLSPKGSLTVWGDHHLVFADIESPHTIRNLAANPATEINVVDPFIRKGYRFRGRANVVRGGDTYWKILDAYKAEGADVRRVRTIVLVEVTHAAPLVSPVYTLNLSEDEVRRLWEEYHVKSIQKTVVDLIPPNDF
ncbi:MAG: pyridoxamine 5'-phosphate oxidase family protein [Thermoplasmata archaeon]|nr:pyridoxamine 5'-phosphate oxidase family protein [Thermoplasmata archaeon]